MKKSIDLDAILDPAQAADWLGISKRKLLEGVRAGSIPVCRINKRVLRFHPRAILAELTKHKPNNTP